METQELRVSYHSMRRYAQRIEGKDIDEQHKFSFEEARRYTAEIRKRVKHATPLPQAACLLFVNRGIRMKHAHAETSKALSGDRISSNAGETYWGKYLYDGELCFVIQDNTVITTFPPDESQATTIDELLLRSKSEPNALVNKKMSADLKAAIRIVEKRDRSHGRLPKPMKLEFFFSSHRIKSINDVTPSFLATILRWVMRADADPQWPMHLYLSPHYAFLSEWLLPMMEGNISINIFPDALDASDRSTLEEQTSDMREFRKIMERSARSPSPTFILCTKKTMESVLTELEKIHGCIPETKLSDTSILYQVDLLTEASEQRVRRYAL